MGRVGGVKDLVGNLPDCAATMLESSKDSPKQAGAFRHLPPLPRRVA